MKIRMAFAADGQPDDMPTLVVAYDEYTGDDWQGVPDFYTNEVKDARQHTEIREIFVTIPDDAIRNLFAIPVVEGTVVE